MNAERAIQALEQAAHVAASFPYPERWVIYFLECLDNILDRDEMGYVLKAIQEAIAIRITTGSW